MEINIFENTITKTRKKWLKVQESFDLEID
jgi:hypothetical protein